MKVRVKQIVNFPSDVDDQIELNLGFEGFRDFEIDAGDEDEALDKFHETHPVGCLDDYEISVTDDNEGYHACELLKVLHCMSQIEWQKVLKVAEWFDPSEFDDIWATLRQRGLFHALCLLDRGNQNKIFAYAKEKYEGSGR